MASSSFTALRRVGGWLLAAALIVPYAQGAPAPTARIEIDFLLLAIENSGCTFYRNGSWYDAKAAAAHLRSKYEYLLARDAIRDADAFIDKAATKSSISGKAYAIRCPGSPDVLSHDWLTKQLEQYRRATGS
jgi:hypothetical protein